MLRQGGCHCRVWDRERGARGKDVVFFAPFPTPILPVFLPPLSSLGLSFRFFSDGQKKWLRRGVVVFPPAQKTKGNSGHHRLVFSGPAGPSTPWRFSGDSFVWVLVVELSCFLSLGMSKRREWAEEVVSGYNRTVGTCPAETSVGGGGGMI